MNISPEELAPLGLKENYENYLKQMTISQFQAGKEFGKNEKEYLEKAGIDFEALKAETKQIYKDYGEEDYLKVILAVDL